MKDKGIVENYLQALNKGNIICEGLPSFDEVEKSSQQFIEDLDKSDTFSLKNK